MIRLYSEWDLGVPEFYANIDLAYETVKEAVPAVCIEDDIDELMKEGLIQFEIVDVVGEQDD